MEVKIQSIHFDADQRLLDHIEKKVEKIKKLYPKVTGVHVFLKLDASNGGIHQKISEIKVNLPGKILFAEDASGSFEESLDIALENVLSQLKKHKDKQQA